MGGWRPRRKTVIKETRIGSDRLAAMFSDEEIKYEGWDGLNHVFRINTPDGSVLIYSDEVFEVTEEADDVDLS